MAFLKGGVDIIDFQLFYILIRIIPAVGTLLSWYYMGMEILLKVALNTITTTLEWEILEGLGNLEIGIH